jgi:hypothetical protein
MADNGTIVSVEVLTAAPVDVADFPVLAIAFVRWLAMAAALSVACVVVEVAALLLDAVDVLLVLLDEVVEFVPLTPVVLPDVLI